MATIHHYFGSKRVLCVVLVGVLVVAAGIDAPRKEVRTISYEDIPERVQIIGKLKLPLGNLVTVSGRWTQFSRSKPSLPIFVVDRVDGKPLDPPAEFAAIEAVQGGLEKSSFDRKAGDAWELRGVETGGFVGFSEKVLEEARGNGPISSPAPGGFLTKFCFVRAQRLSNDATKK